MSNVFSKVVTWFVLLVILVAILSTARSELMAGGAAYDMLVAVFDDFPFAQQMAEIVSNIGQYSITLQGLSPTNVITDLTKLFGMTLVCPLVVGIATLILLPVPNYTDWYDRERYMSRPGYRIKETLLHVVAMPICAWATAALIDVMQTWLAGRLPFVNPALLSLLLLAVMLALSTLAMWLRSDMSFGSAFRHRLITDLLGNLLKILGLNLICFGIALGILNDQGGVALSLVVLLFIYMMGIGLMLDAVRGVLS